MRTLRGYLVAMAILLVVLLSAGMALALHQVDAYGRAQNERQLLDTARALSLAVDGQTRSYESLLLALRQSEALQRQDWRSFDAQARSLLSGTRGAWIVVGDPQGRQLVNTGLPPGAVLPGGTPAAEQWRVLRTGRTHFCNLVHGYVVADILCVDVPVMREGQLAYSLSVVFRPRLLDSIFAAERKRTDRFVTVLDRNQTIIWRNLSPERFIGQPARAEMRAALAVRSQGLLSSVSLEGVPTRVAFSRSALTGWTFVVAVPRAESVALSERTLAYGMLGAALFLIVGAGVGVAAGGRVAGAIGHLSAAAARIGQGAAPAYQPSGLAEVDAVGEALTTAVREREGALERFRLAQEVGGIGAWEWDLERDEGRVSDSFKAMHGLTHIDGPLKSADLRAAIHPDDRAGYDARFARAQRRTSASSSEYRVVLPDGSIRWIYARARPQAGPDGSMPGALGVVIDVTERKENEERLRLLMREVDHRANNIMAVIQAAVKLSRASNPAELQSIIVGRVQALARAHQLLSESRWRGADLRRLVEDELRPYVLGDEARLTLEGPPAPLSPAVAQGAAMALHELATNAAKHGALSVEGGRLHIAWEISGDRLLLRWTESGGPPVLKPARAGFGTTVLQRALAGAVGGATRLDWRAQGLVCELEMPLAKPD